MRAWELAADLAAEHELTLENENTSRVMYFGG